MGGRPLGFGRLTTPFLGARVKATAIMWKRRGATNRSSCSRLTNRRSPVGAGHRASPTPGLALARNAHSVSVEASRDRLRVGRGVRPPPSQERHDLNQPRLRLEEHCERVYGVAYVRYRANAHGCNGCPLKERLAPYLARRHDELETEPAGRTVEVEVL